MFGARAEEFGWFLAGVSLRVLQLFEMTRVDKFFPRVGTVEEADQLWRQSAI
jgi:hypothetical protein